MKRRNTGEAMHTIIQDTVAGFLVDEMKYTPKMLLIDDNVLVYKGPLDIRGSQFYQVKMTATAAYVADQQPNPHDRITSFQFKSLDLAVSYAIGQSLFNVQGDVSRNRQMHIIGSEEAYFGYHLSFFHLNYTLPKLPHSLTLESLESVCKTARHLMEMMDDMGQVSGRAGAH